MKYQNHYGSFSRENFSSLIEDVVDSLVIEDYKTTVNNRRYDLKNAENFLLEIISRKISQNEALELHSKDKRNNILNILSNLESILSKIWKKVSQRELAIKEKMISLELFNKYFGYSNPSDMYIALNETTGSKENKAQVNTIENRFANLMEVLKNNPTDDTKKLKT